MSVIVWTILVTPVVWLIYKVASFILDVKRRAAGISRFPSPDPFHWFLGHIDFVSIVNAQFSFVTLYYPFEELHLDLPLMYTVI